MKLICGLSGDNFKHNAFCIHFSYRLYFPNTTWQVHRTQYFINDKMKIVKRDMTRMPQRTSLHSFNLLWLMWAVCGGLFITKFILCNWLTILIKPVFDEPINTAEVNNISRSTLSIIIICNCLSRISLKRE